MLALLLTAAALAHTPGLSYVRVGDGEISLSFARAELEGRMPLDDLHAASDLVVQATLDRALLRVGDTPCTYGPVTVRELIDATGDGIEVVAPLDCPAGDTWHLRAGFLAELEAGHRTYVEVDGAPVAVLDAARPEVSFGAVASPAEVAARWLWLGVEHIVTGYDHLAFLVGLLLTAASLRQMLVIVSGFTVAHSITLVLAALGVVTPPSALVEAAIAASIVFVGVENLWRPPPRRRAIVTFALGLVHGFGFAGMLAELGLPRRGLVLALVCFNGGVELGQAAIVVVAMPLLLALRRAPAWERWGVPIGSLGVAALGLGWLVTRLAAL